jgi:spoIIIJ-associated protein
VEWVEVTARTVEEAKEAALDQLGVDEADAEFEVVEAPKGGLFGRLRSEARVRARVLPTTPRPKVERRERRRQGGRERGAGPGRSRSQAREGRQGEARAANSGGDGRGADDRVASVPSGPPIDESQVAEDFLRGLLDVYGVDYTLQRRDGDDDITEFDVRGQDLGLLIGHRGQTLAAVQELTRTAVQRAAGTSGSSGRRRILVDVAGYRQARKEALARFTRTAAEQVLASGIARVLEPMRAPDRKVVHDTVNEIAGVSTTSEGEEPRRRVVIRPDAPA